MRMDKLTSSSRFTRFATLTIVTMFLLTLSTATLFAQSQAKRGKISGSGADSAGPYIAGASIKVTNPATGFNQTVSSNEDGQFRAVLLPPGEYSVQISK